MNRIERNYDYYNALKEASKQKTKTNSPETYNATEQERQDQTGEQNVLVRSGATVLDLATAIGTGMFKFGEGVVDSLVYLGGAVGGVFDENVRKDAENFIAKDYTGETFAPVQKQLNEWGSYLDDNPVGQTIEQVGQGVGQILPNVLLSVATGGASNALTMGTLGVSAAGNSVEEAFNDGADYGKAGLYGAARGLTEVATEKMFGGATKNIYGKGALDKVVGKATGGALNKGLGKVVRNFAEEGIEEAVSELANPLAKSIYKGKDALAEYGTEDYWKGVGEQGLVGGLTGVVAGGTIGKINAKQTEIGENLQEIRKLENTAERMDANDTLSEEYDRRITNRIRDDYKQIESTLKSVNEEKRAKLIKQFNLSEVFDSDGGLNAEYTAERGLNVYDGQAVGDEGNGGVKSLASGSKYVSRRIRYSSTLARDIEGLNESAKLKGIENPNVRVFDGELSDKGGANYTDTKSLLAKINRKTNNGINLVVIDSNAKNIRGVTKRNTIYISKDALESGEGLRKTVHELVHVAQKGKTRQYKDLVNLLAEDEETTAKVIDSLTREGNGYGFTYEMFEKIREKGHTGERLTDIENEMLDEIGAWMGEAVLSDERIINRLVRDDTTFASNLINRIQDVSETLRSLRSPAAVKEYRRLKKTEAMYMQAIEAAGYKWSRGKIIGGDDKDETRGSYSSIAYTFFGDSDVSIKDMESGSYVKTEGYKKYVDSCLNNMRQSRGVDFDRASALKEIDDSIKGIVDVAVAMKKAGYDILDSEGKRSTRDSKKRLLFSSLEPNSDYFTSSDISTICDKRLNFAEIYDEIVRREVEMGVPEGKRFFSNADNYFVIHKIMAEKGLTQPCKQCYVESMRKNLLPMAEAFISMVKEKDVLNTSNKLLWAKAKDSDSIVVIGRDNKRYVKKVTNSEIRDNVLRTLEEHPEYGLTVDDFEVDMFATADGLADLKIKAPLIYEYFNSFYGQAKPKMPKEATPFRFGELTALLTDDNNKIRKGSVDKIKATGGFRLQSYSDFQIQNFVDVLQVIFEAGTLGLNGHAYTKVPAFLDATKNTNLKRNISIFMYKDGEEWKIDRNDSFPYSLEKIYDIVDSDESGNTSIIAVVQNEDMAAWIMANDKIGYFIPFHKSGIKMSTVRATIVKEGGREIKGYSNIKDHTRQQSEVWKYTTSNGKAGTKVSKPIDIYSFWDFANEEGLSHNELIEKNVKRYIDECEKAGYLPKFREYVMNNSKVLSNVLAYAKKLGFVSPEATVNDISFKHKGYTIPYGYYKCLGDFGMFKPNGEASPIETLSLRNYDFEAAVDFFKNAESIRRTELLQQIANGEERERYITGDKKDMTTDQIAREIQSKRKAVVDQVVDRDTNFSLDSDRDSESTAKDFVAHLRDIVKTKGRWYDRDVFNYIKDNPELNFIERIYEKDKQVKNDLATFLDGIDDLKTLDSLSWFMGEAYGDKGAAINWNTINRDYPYRGAVRTFRNAIKRRVNAIMTESVGGTNLGIKNGKHSLSEAKELFYRLNSNTELGEFAEKVFSTAEKLGVNIRFVNQTFSKDVAGDAIGDMVEYKTSYFNDTSVSDQRKASTILHELIHTCTVYVLDENQTMGDVYYRGKSKNYERIANAATRLNAIYSEIKDDPMFKGQYGIKNVKEMVASLSNEDFVGLLKKKNLWDRVVDFICNLFGIRRGTSAYDNARLCVDYILDNPEVSEYKAHSIEKRNDARLYGYDIFGETQNSRRGYAPTTNFSLDSEYNLPTVSELDKWFESLSFEELQDLIGETEAETIEAMPTKRERREAYVSKLYEEGKLNRVVTKLLKSKPQMAEYFANTKMNKRYDPLFPTKGDEYVVMFHGTPNDFNVFETKRIGKNGTVMGSGHYFTASLDYAERYKEDGGRVIATLLNIEKPLSRSKHEITKKDLRAFISTVVDATGDDYLSNYGDVYREGYDKVITKAVDRLYESNTNDADMIEEIYVTSRMDYDEFHDGLTDMLGYDGIIAWNKSEGTQAVVFRSNQAKDIFNFAPTEDSDIRFALQIGDTEVSTTGRYQFETDTETLLRDISEQNNIERFMPKGLSADFIKAIRRSNGFAPSRLYRGMEAAEMDYIIENGFIKSNSSYNFTNQQGQTRFSPQIQTALSYATGFAPAGIREKFFEQGLPAYIVEVGNYADLNFVNEDTMESYTKKEIDTKYITRVIELTYDAETKKVKARDIQIEGMNQAKGEPLHGVPSFVQDKVTGTILYEHQDTEGYEDGKYISEKNPDILFDFDMVEKHKGMEFDYNGYLGISGDPANLVPYKADGMRFSLDSSTYTRDTAEETYGLIKEAYDLPDSFRKGIQSLLKAMAVSDKPVSVAYDIADYILADIVKGYEKDYSLTPHQYESAKNEIVAELTRKDTKQTGVQRTKTAERWERTLVKERADSTATLSATTERLARKVESLTKRLTETLTYAGYTNRIAYTTEQLKKVKLGILGSASTYSDSSIFNGTINSLSRLTWQGNLVKPKKVREIIGGMLEWYTPSSSVFGEGTGRFDADLHEALVGISAGKGRLTTDDLKAIDAMLRLMLHVAKNENSIFRNNKRIEALPLATTYVGGIEDVAKYRKPSGMVKKFINDITDTILDPMAVANRADGYTDGFWTDTVKELQDAAIRDGITMMNLNKPIDQFFRKHRGYAKRLDKTKVKFGGGELTVGEAISLHMTYKREQAKAGLEQSGFVVQRNDNRVSFDPVTAESMSELYEAFSDDDKAYIKLVETAMEECKALKIKVDEELKGYTNAIEGYYYPISRAYIAQNIDSQSFDELNRASSASFNKDTVKGAKGALFINPVTRVVGTHIRGMARYYAYAIPISNFNRLFNLNTGKNPNVPRSIKSVNGQKGWGKGEAYIKKLISDLQGIRKVSDSDKAIGWIRGSYAKYQLGANPKVWFTQLSSYVAAFSKLKTSSLIKGIGVPGKDVDKYCDLAMLRNYDKSAAMAQGVLETTGKVGDALMKPISMVDRAIIERLFGACQIEAQSRGYELGSEENKVKAGEILKDVILGTQQNALATERSRMMRSESEIVRSFTMFSADAMKVFSRFVDGVGEVSTLNRRLKELRKEQASKEEIEKVEASLKKAKTKLGKSASALVGQSVMMVLIAKLFRWLYNKEDEDENFTVELIGNMIGGIPLVRDMYSYFFEGYEIDNFFLGTLNDVLGATNKMFGIAGDIMDGKEISDQETASAIKGMVNAVGQSTGIPTRNIYNVAYGLTSRVSESAAYKWDSKFRNKSFTADLGKAIEEGDLELAVTIANIMMGESGIGGSDKVSAEVTKLYSEGFKALPKSLGDTLAYENEIYNLSADDKESFRKVYGQATSVAEKVIDSKLYSKADAQTRAKALKYIYDLYYNLGIQEVLGVEMETKSVLFSEAIPVDILAMVVAYVSALPKDENGAPGYRKTKIQAYISALNISAAQKYMLMGYLGYKNKNGETQVKSYINRLSLTKEQKESLFKMSGYDD